MKEYIASELIKEKREKHSYLGLLCLAILLVVFFSNLYKLTRNASVLDLYCDNMEMHFFITLFFAALYTIVLFADEYRYGTIYQLEIIPVSPLKYILAKLTIVMAFNAIIMALISLICVAIMGIQGFGLEIHYLGILLLINLADAILLSSVMVPISLFVISCKGNYILSLLISICYIILCFMITSFPISQDMAQKITAYTHPLGSYALIHNWLIYKLVPYETSMLSQPKESGLLALIGLVVWVIICFALSVILMRKKKDK